MRFFPGKTLPAALAITLLAAGMSIGTASANGWPQPNIACNENNAGTFYDVEYYAQWQRLQITYYCDGVEWQLWQVCDLNPGGICYAY